MHVTIATGVEPGEGETEVAATSVSTLEFARYTELVQCEMAELRALVGTMVPQPQKQPVAATENPLGSAGSTDHRQAWAEYLQGPSAAPTKAPPLLYDSPLDASYPGHGLVNPVIAANMYRIPQPGQMSLIVGKSSLFKGQLAHAVDLFTVITNFRDFSSHQRLCGDWSQAFTITLSTNHGVDQAEHGP